MFQNYSLFAHMTVAENVEFGLAVRKMPEGERARKRDELLALVGLTGFAGPLSAAALGRPATAGRGGARARLRAVGAPAR